MRLASEFDLIRRHFTRPTAPAAGVALGVGDDATLLRPAPGFDLVTTTDMLVAGTHFLPETDPADLGWKTLAVNVSDIAAMGARPRWALLALALPAPDALGAVASPLCFEDWLAAFSKGFFACADAYDVALVGGDTTRGPLCLSVTMLGEAPAGTALRRDGAAVGDDVWVSGAPGRAALGLAHLQGRVVLPAAAAADCIAALQRPQPRVALGLALRGVASACIDVSDGLLADLGHIAERSGLALALAADALPPLAWASAVPPPLCFQCVWSGGDDYELAFTAPPARRDAVLAAAAQAGVTVTRIGMARDGVAGTVTLTDATGADITPARRGFDHFG